MAIGTGEITTVKLQVGSGGRRYVTIPKTISNLLELKKGEEFGVYIKENEIVFRRTKI